ncbi:hypothetical protein [Solibacillus cecembensis]|uniref:hypothetical protein n=1 Tax=Solibacillus cecembensis TaxID=459347 RepID=UPI00071738D1
MLIIIGLIMIGIFFFEPFRSEPPTPNVTIGDVDIPTTQGSFCWHGLLSGQCIDKIYTSPLDMADEHKPTGVSPNEEISITFKKEPLEGTMVVEQLVDENNKIDIEVKNDIIKVPKEKGVYAYYVIANWERGNGNYAFSIEVK